MIASNYVKWEKHTTVFPEGKELLVRDNREAVQLMGLMCEAKSIITWKILQADLLI